MIIFVSVFILVCCTLQKKFFTVVKILEKSDRTCVYLLVIGSMFEWLECQNCNQHGLDSKPTHPFCYILGKDTLCDIFLLGGHGKQF